MRAEEVVWLYQRGERNFRGQNLAGESFAGQNLAGADFSKTNIRGASFTNARLSDCLFTEARAGLRKGWAIAIFLTTLVMCTFLGLLLSSINGLAALKIAEFAEYGFESALARWTITAILVTFLLVARYWEVEAGFSLFTIAFVVAIAVAGLTSEAIPIAGTVAIAVMIAYLTVILAGLAGVVVAIAAYIVTEAIAAVLISVFAFAALVVNPQHVDLLMIVMAISIALLSAYTCWRTLRRGRGNTLIRNIVGTMVTFVAARVGTSFRGADLTNADFSGAQLNGTDFSRVITGNAQRSMLLN